MHLFFLLLLYFSLLAFTANNYSLSAILLKIQKFIFSTSKHKVCPVHFHYWDIPWPTITCSDSLSWAAVGIQVFLLALSFSFLFLKYVSLDPDLARLSWDFEFTAQSLRMSIVFQGTAL